MGAARSWPVWAGKSPRRYTQTTAMRGIIRIASSSWDTVCTWLTFRAELYKDPGISLWIPRPGFRNLPATDYPWDIFASLSPFSSIIYPNSTSCRQSWFLPTSPNLWIFLILQKLKGYFFLNPYTLETSSHQIKGADVNSALSVRDT